MEKVIKNMKFTKKCNFGRKNITRWVLWLFGMELAFHREIEKSK